MDKNCWDALPEWDLASILNADPQLCSDSFSLDGSLWAPLIVHLVRQFIDILLRIRKMSREALADRFDSRY